jgi:hypothetical protein
VRARDQHEKKRILDVSIAACLVPDSEESSQPPPLKHSDWLPSVS